MAAKLPVLRITGASYASVFGRLDRFHSLTWRWMLILWAAAYALTIAAAYAPPGSESALAVGYLLVAQFSAGLGVLWHRHIQFGESVPSWRGVRFGRREFLYLAFQLGFTLLTIAPALPILLPEIAAGQQTIGVIIAIIVYPIAFYVCFRALLALPLIAVDETRPFATSWGLMRGNLWRLIFIGLLTLMPTLIAFNFFTSLYGILERHQAAGPLRFVLSAPICGLIVWTGTMMVCLRSSYLSHVLLQRRGLMPDSASTNASAPPYAASTAPSAPITERAPSDKLPAWALTKAAYATVFHAFRAFLARTWAWMLVVYVITTPVVIWAHGQSKEVFEARLETLFATPVLYAIMIQWTRGLALGEWRTGVSVIQWPKQLWRLIGLLTLLFLTVLAPFVILTGFAIGLTSIVGADHYGATVVILGLAALVTLLLCGALTYIFLRLCLLQPLIALDERRPFDVSWHLSKGNLWRVIIIGLLCNSPNAIFGSLVHASFESGLAALLLLQIPSVFLTTLTTCITVSALTLILFHRRGLPFPAPPG